MHAATIDPCAGALLLFPPPSPPPQRSTHHRPFLKKQHDAQHSITKTTSHTTRNPSPAKHPPSTPPPPPTPSHTQSLDVLESRVTGIAKSKWVMYGPFFVEVLARAAAHFRGQQAGSISMEEELFIDYNTLPGGWGDWCVCGGGAIH